MNTAFKLSLYLLALTVPAMPGLADTEQLACRGDTYVVASDQQQAIKRFSTREIKLTTDEDSTAISYAGGEPMQAEITEFHYRAVRFPRSGDWLLILLDRETLDITVSEFTSLSNHKHRSVRFEGKCKPQKPLAYFD
jgi:hypothetical protein